MAQQQPSGIMGAMNSTQGNSADASLGGMAQAVDTKVEAFRNNPQALEKRLANNKQLLDLLALQKVKSEKEAAKNQLILSEQQVPSTILEQREQEVLAMNKDDLAKQTAGILGQRQKQKQQQMSRPPMPQGAPQQPPMMAARGGLLPLPRPNMQKMSQGGIMGYADGGQVDRVKAFIAQRGGKLTQQEMADIVNASKNNPEVIAFLTQNQGFEDVAKEMADIDKSAIALAAPAGAPIANSSIANATARGAGKAPVANTSIANATAIGAGGEKEKEKENIVSPLAAAKEVPVDDVPANIPKEAVVKEMPSGFGKMVGSAVDWAKENPIEAVGVGMMFIPGLGWAASGAVRAASLGMKAYNAAKKVDYGKKLANAAKVAKGVPPKLVSRPAKLPTRNAKGQITKQGEAGRQYSKGRTATTGMGIYGAGKIAGMLSDDGKGINSVAEPATTVAEPVAPVVDDKLTGSEVLEVIDKPKSFTQQAEDIVNEPRTETPPVAVQTIEDMLGEDYMKKTRDTAGADAQVGADAAAKRSDENLNRAGVAEKMQGGIDSLKNLTEKVQKPSFLDDKRALFAAAGRGGIQGVMDIGLMQDRQRDQFAFSKLREANDLENKKIKADIDIGRIGQTAANAVFGALTKSSSDAMAVLGNIGVEKVKIAERSANAIVAKNQAAIDNQLKILSVKIEEAKLASSKEANRQTAVLNLTKILTDAKTSLDQTAAMIDSTGAELYQKQLQFEKDNPGQKIELSAEDAATLDAHVVFRGQLEGLSTAIQALQSDLMTSSGVEVGNSKKGTYGQ